MKNTGSKRTLYMIITAAMAGISAAELYAFGKAAKVLADPTILDEAITVNKKPLVKKPKDNVEEK